MLVTDSLPGFLISMQHHIGCPEDFLSGASQRQEILGSIAERLQSELGEQIRTVDNGTKTIERAREKIKTKYGNDSRLLYDFNREIFYLETPAMADEIARSLAATFECFDTGWKLRNAGKITRQFLIGIEHERNVYAAEFICEMSPPKDFLEYHQLKYLIYECRRCFARQDHKPEFSRLIEQVHAEIDKLAERGIYIRKVDFSENDAGRTIQNLTEQSRAIHDAVLPLMSAEWRTLHQKLEASIKVGQANEV